MTAEHTYVGYMQHAYKRHKDREIAVTSLITKIIPTVDVIYFDMVGDIIQVS